MGVSQTNIVNKDILSECKWYRCSQPISSAFAWLGRDLANKNENHHKGHSSHVVIPVFMLCVHGQGLECKMSIFSIPVSMKQNLKGDEKKVNFLTLKIFCVDFGMLQYLFVVSF